MRKSFAAMLVLLACATPLRAQRIGVEVLGDIEAWKTDAGSRLLARNNGDAMLLGRLHTWLMIRPGAAFELVALGEAEASTADGDEAEAELEMLSLRWLPSRYFSVEAGRILMPVGSFGRRRFSNVNSLIGSPDLYPTLYPWGAMASGAAGSFDYRAGVVSLPVVNTKYTPAPGDYLRPVVGAGYSFGPSLHIGAALTHGPYLGPDQEFALADGDDWQNYKQTIAALDVRYSIGYVELWGEYARSSYEVPLAADNLSGYGLFTEARITHSPRFFTALRLEYFDYPFIRPVSTTRWIGNLTTQMNGEAGIGFRVNESVLAKLSYRRDHWPDTPGPGAPPSPDGYAIAAQLSIAADILGMFARRY
jgi:hypothetical protein